MPSALLIVAGLAGLLVGADLLVRGGAALAAGLGVRPIVIGLTVVSVGTSLPELAVGVDAVRQGSPGLAVGNIVGTNLVNILLILGISALIRPIAFERRTLRFDLPAMTGASLALWLFAPDGSLSLVDGIILCLGGAAYTAGIVWTSRQESEAVRADYASRSQRATSRGGRALLRRGATMFAGIGLVLLGAELLVDGSIDVARSLDVSDAIIGLTVIASAVIGPVAWVIAWLVAIWLLERTNAIEFGLLVTIVSFFFALAVLGLLHWGRSREERRFDQADRRFDHRA